MAGYWVLGTWNARLGPSAGGGVLRCPRLRLRPRPQKGGEGHRRREVTPPPGRTRRMGDVTYKSRLRALGSLLVGDGLLLTHGGDDGDEEVLALVEVVLDLLAELAVGELDVVLGGAVLGHEVEETVVDVDLGA